MYRILRLRSALATNKRNAKQPTPFGSATDSDPYELFVVRDSAMSNRWQSRSCRNQKIEGTQKVPVVWQNNGHACLKWVYTFCLVLRTIQQ